TSRMGWVMMALWGCGYAYRRLMRFGSIRISLGSWLVTINICLLLAAGLGAAAAFKSQRVLQFFAGGTGLFGTPAHSVTERESRFWNTLHLVNKSPFIG